MRKLSFTLLTLLLAVSAVAPKPARSQALVVGEGGRGWRELATRWIALDDTTTPGAIQPKELRPWENIMVGSEKETNIFGFQWHASQTGMEVLGRELGVNPRVWSGTFPGPALLFLDGDPTTSLPVLKVVPQDEFDQHATQTGGAYSAGFRQDWREAWTFDLAFPVPVERVRFYPPQRGVDAEGVPLSRRAPQGFELSVARTPEERLLLGSEGVSQIEPYGALDQLILRTLLNSESIVDLRFDLQPLRFLRLNVGLIRQRYSVAELEVYGRGVPLSVEYVSGAIDMGQAVNFGRIDYDLRAWRRTADDHLVEDPSAPVALSLQTRSGRDDTPQAYWVIDELGRDRPATREQYERADLPKSCCLSLRLPGMRSAITEDTEQWSTWSSPYAASGEENRSPDGRRWLQFRFELTTADPLAFAQLRSFRFAFSPLLATSLTGEVALLESPDRKVVSVPVGQTQRYALDVRARFDGGESGFDAIRLGVPRGARFHALEMADDERSFEAVNPDSLASAEGMLTVHFPNRRIDADHNPLVRVIFETAVYNSTTVFTAEVFDVGSQRFPQSVDPGDANPGVASDGLEVFAEERALSIVADLRLVPPVLTPNGDGINDSASLTFDLMAIEGAAFGVDVLDLGGRVLRRIDAGVLRQGTQSILWDGLDAAGHPVAPGLYVARLVLDVQGGAGEHMLLVPVVY